jgi:hypothetical protein
MIFARLATTALLAVAAVPAVAADVTYELINNSSLTLAFFYTSPSSDPHWSEDFLGEAVLAPSESGIVTLYGASDICAYDVKFVMEDGQELTDQVNVCELASYTLED